MDYGLKIITEKHSEAACELAEHLDCKDDAKGIRLLEEVLDYTTMLVRFLNDYQRQRVKENGNAQRHKV